MSDDILDLFAGKYKPSKPKSQDAGYNAPLELMSQFLLLITENKMKEALVLSKEILSYEPNNRIVLEYQSALRDYIDQGNESLEAYTTYLKTVSGYADPKPEEKEEDDDEEGDDDEEEDDDDDDDDSDKENEDDSSVEESKQESKR